MTDLYFSIDIETNGPVPALYSMLSIGVKLIPYRGLDEPGYDVAGPPMSFYRTLRLDPDAGVSPQSMDWWDAFPEAYVAARTRLSDPADAMAELTAWVKEHVAAYGHGDDGEPFTPIAVCAPAAFDFPFVAYYLRKHTGGCVFGYSAVDLRSVIMGRTGMEYRQAGSENYLPEWVTHFPHTHNALDDATEQADVFMRVMKGVRNLKCEDCVSEGRTWVPPEVKCSHGTPRIIRNWGYGITDEIKADAPSEE